MVLMDGSSVGGFGGSGRWLGRTLLLGGVFFVFVFNKRLGIF